MSKLHFLKGDATQPQAKGNKIITHVCNDLGGWGKGFVVAISKRWPEPEIEYRKNGTKTVPKMILLLAQCNLSKWKTTSGLPT